MDAPGLGFRGPVGIGRDEDAIGGDTSGDPGDVIRFLEEFAFMLNVCDEEAVGKNFAIEKSRNRFMDRLALATYMFDVSTTYKDVRRKGLEVRVRLLLC